MKLQFVGCGDAFGSGGRFNTCFHVTGERVNFFIDCGASSVISMKQLGIAHNDVDTILFTHFHADHFGGLPFLILDAQFFSKRTAPLIIAGPKGIKEWYVKVMETAFPGSSKTKQKFDLTMIELEAGQRTKVGDVHVTPQFVSHGNPGGPFFALRVEAEGKTIAYTGDTEWTDTLIDAGKDADLFIAEAYFYEKQVPLHLNLVTIKEKLPLINPKRLVLTHMNDDMLNRLDDLSYEFAEDGKIIEF